MKIKLIYLSLALVLLACRQKHLEASSLQTNVGSMSEIMVVEPSEIKEQKQIQKQALSLLDGKDYDELEALAAKNRTSKEGYADGMWKLAYFYTGLELKEEDAETVWKAREKQIRDWVQEKPKSVTARVELARFLTDYAWKARGSGSASTVTDEGGQLFGQRLQEAAKVLADVRQLDGKCPVFWSTMQKVALGLQLDRKRYDSLFNAATKEFPDYPYYYRSRAIYLLPRWYGVDGELERDLEKSADRIGGEAGDMLYARVVWALREYGSVNVFEEHHLSWKRADRGFEAILKNFPDSLAAKNIAAHLATQAHDPAAAKKYFLLTNGHVDLRQWEDKDQYWHCCIWALAQ